jgi:hypothetical protein
MVILSLHARIYNISFVQISEDHKATVLEKMNKKVFG